MDGLLTAKELAQHLGITKQAVMKRAEKESWPFQNGNGKGGSHRKYPLASLPADIQKAVVAKQGAPTAMLPALAPEAALEVVGQRMPLGSFTEGLTDGNGLSLTAWTPETAISEKDLRDPRVRRILAIIREAEAMPRTWTQGRRRWIESIATRHDCSFQAVYRWMKKYEKRGIAGIVHTKATREKPRAWTPEAVDFWIGLALKKEHRKVDLRALYTDALAIEAQRRGWKIGTYESARWWYDRRVTPQLLALQKGGLRALDNVLPPVLRDYSDLQPFEMLVGDQHRFDFWVVDDDTGEVFRPEGYFWQDLRTRIIYGAAIDHRYDAWLIGLALRVGIAIFGAFGSIYTDNGRPELSRYLAGILADMRSLGLEWERTLDVPVDVLDVEAEDVHPAVIVPGTHRKAIVKNAKAKMIEGTFDRIEQILRSRFRLAGSVKRLSDDIHHQDVDQAEAQVLAKAGKLPLFSEFALALYRACDFYNRQKPHRGVLSEWAWTPKPREVTPFDCLRACYENGWRPRDVSSRAADLIFLEKDHRTVNLGRIQYKGDAFEHEALLTLNGQKVDIRVNPLSDEGLIVFHRGQYLCLATPVEYSSMKDRDLAARKIIEKRTRRSRFAEEYRRITAGIPDLRTYSEVPRTEKVAALIEADKRKIARERQEFSRTLTPEELEAGVKQLEAAQGATPARRKPLPARPGFFLDDFSRYEWCIKYTAAGGELPADDCAWKAAYEARMSPDQLDYWKTVQEYGE